jgi:hypothetical protein
MTSCMYRTGQKLLIKLLGKIDALIALQRRIPIVYIYRRNSSNDLQGRSYVFDINPYHF